MDHLRIINIAGTGAVEYADGAHRDCMRVVAAPKNSPLLMLKLLILAGRISLLSVSTPEQFQVMGMSDSDPPRRA